MNRSNLFRKISSQKGSSKIAVNTFIISGQRLFAAILSLVTTPIILNALGVEDYGLYTVVVGLVGMLAFVNWSLSSATQRYIAFAIGAGDREELKKIFVSSLLIHGVYALFLLIIIWLFGGFLVDRFLNIPEARISTAKIIIKFVSVITFINILSVPFTGLFRAYENFLFLAIFGIVESLLKLAIAVALIYIATDKLITYSGLLLIISILVFILTFVFSKRFYHEVNFDLHDTDKSLLNEMLGFTGWSLLGAIAILSRNQGVTILLNVFFGAVANAAYGIALQVNSAMGILSQGIIGAISPQIVKSAGSGDTNKMIYLMRTMSKFTVLILSLIAVPIIFETPFILKLWLKNVPEGTSLYTRLIICFTLLTGLSAGINNVFEAIGRVKLYNIYVSLLLILNLPLAYIFFKMRFPGYTIILTGMVLEVVSLFVRLYLLKKYVNFSLVKFLNDVIFKIAIPIMLSAGLVILIRQINLNENIRLFITFATFFTVYPLTVYFMSLDQKQKQFADEVISKAFKLNNNWNN